MEKKFKQTIDEKFKALELSDGFDYTSLVKLPSYANGMYQKKFKIPEFEKYDGTGCPIMHTRLYVRRMAKYAQYEQFMIQTFQDSLTGLALTWYTSLT